MSELTGPLIVQRAMQLLCEQPMLSALNIIDAAMEGHHGTHPNFDAQDPWSDAPLPHPGYWEDLMPPSPFAELLRRAFDPSFDPREVALVPMAELGLESASRERLDKIEDRWQAVIDAFAARYRLWR